MPAMGRKLDLSGLTDNEAEHVLQVVQRDMRLRKKEEERLSELKQEMDEEGSRCLLLSRQSCFNQRCCIRCCSPFTFLLNPKRQCRDCHYNVCKACRVFNKRDKAWLCSACQKTRLLKTQSLEWFYTNVKKRFKRFGSAKVLKTLYRKHLAEHSALSELTECSAYEESICNEGSVCESDSTFYRQSEEHSMAETLSVALRVAEETIDEAISKAEFNSASQKKQNEANYLREHRGELIEELAKTIVQKIISRRKTLAEMKAEYDPDWALGQNTDLHHPQSTSDQASSSLQHQPGLWRSHSAFSLLANDPQGLIQDSSQTLKKEGGGSTVSAWKSVDRLDNAGVSSVLKSPDGNWIALQSAQLSRPSLLTKRKSLVYSALERESGVVSAYEGMDSDNEAKPELDSSWGAVLQEIHRKMTESNLNLQDTRDRITSTLMGHQGRREDVLSDSEGNRKPNKPLLALFKRKLPVEIRRPSSSCRTSVIDMNFNIDPPGEGEHGSVCAEPEVGKIRRSRRKRRSKKEQVASSAVVELKRKDNQSDHTSDAVTPDTLNSGATTPELFDRESNITECGANQMDERLQQHEGRVSDFSTREEELDKSEDADNDDDDDGQRVERRQGNEDRGDENERLWKMEIDLDEDGTGDENEEEERDLQLDDEDMKDRLYRLVTQSSLTYFSSTDEELDKVGQSEGKWEEDMKDDDEETKGLTHRLCQLEKEVRASQFSSTEDELDRVAVDEKEEGEDEELLVKVCRLADQVDTTQFSSTEDELDTAERGEEEEDVINEQTLWKLQAEKAVQAAQLRDLASLVSASQFSSTEDELDRVGEDDRVIEQEANGGGAESSTEMEELQGGEVERRESFGDLDVKMFDLRDEIEELKNDSSDAKVTDILDNPIKTEDVQQDNTEEDEPENIDLIENAKTGEMKNERTGVEKQTCEEELEDEAERAKDAEEREEIKLKTVSEAEKMEERTEEMKINETRVEQENQPEAEWPDEKEEDRRGEEKFKVKWEMAADSNEEDPEFDRIISSMLMMTFEDMQVETLKDEAAENGRVSRELEDGEANENVESGGESEFREKAVDAENTNASEETGTGREFQSGGDMRPESAVEERLEESVTERTGGHVSRQKESRHATSRHENEQEEINLPKEKPETNEAEQTCETREVDEEDRRETTQVQREITAEGESTKEEMDEKYEETKGNPDDMEQSSTSFLHECLLSPQEIQNGRDMELYKTVEFVSTLLEQSYSAASLRSITTEVLKVLNATEDLLQGVEGGETPPLSITSLPLDSDPTKLDQQFSRLEENVYMAAGSVYSLEAELNDLEECARGICSSTSDMELSYLEEQVASAAAKVQQSELHICDISARIAALKSAGLNVDTQSRFKTRTIPVMPVTLDSSRQLRRRLPAPPVKEDKDT